ncbi:MAG: shikimate kinase, partial [Henriciella sp.]
LWKRVSRRSHRPLLRQPNPRAVLRNLQETRDPIYALADVHVESVDGAHSETVDKILRALDIWSAERRG